MPEGGGIRRGEIGHSEREGMEDQIETRSEARRSRSHEGGRRGVRERCGEGEGIGAGATSNV